MLCPINCDEYKKARSSPDRTFRWGVGEAGGDEEMNAFTMNQAKFVWWSTSTSPHQNPDYLSIFRGGISRPS